MRNVLVILLLSLCLLPLVAAADAPPAPQQRQLDPTKPADALAIVDLLTRHATWPGQDREQVVALERALATLAGVIAPRPEPVEIPKAGH